MMSLLERSERLKDLVKESKLEAVKLLEDAAKTGDVVFALKVFISLQDLLPKHHWIIREEQYPLLYAHLGHVDRYREVNFLDYLEEDLYVLLNESSSGEPWEEGDITIATNFAWELIRNGKSGCTWDW